MSKIKKGDIVRLTKEGTTFVYYKSPQYVTKNVIPDDLTTLDFVVEDVVKLFVDAVELKIKGDVDKDPLMQLVSVEHVILMD